MKNKTVNHKSIAIIGGGNLGVAIAEGLLISKFCNAPDITITRRNIAQLKPLAEKKINTTDNNLLAVKNSDVVILAIKPFQIMEVLQQIKKELTSNKIIISVVTGVSIKEIQEVIKNNIPVFRAMPNTAIAIRESMTCICSKESSAADVEYVNNLFNNLGKTITIDEKLMEASTVLGACGIAYALRFIRANIQGGIEIGFDARTANLIAAQTVKGAAALLIETGRHPEQEIDKVTTPKGCTIAGLNEMEHQGFSSSLIRGIITSYKKIAKD